MKIQILQRIFIGACVVLFSLSCLQARKMPDWTVAVYMEAGTPDMHYWVHKNMNDMALAKSDYKKLNIVTQVHLEKTEAWRYVVRQNAIKPLETTMMNADCAQNIVDFMKWTVKHYPAKQYGLIFWGHGFGILDPSHRPTPTDPFAFDVEPDEPGHECQGGVCPLKLGDFFTNGHLQHRTPNEVWVNHALRGFMFNDTPTFVNNAQLISALKTIKETVLNGKKVDVIGTDCCKMAMLEVGYQISDFADYLVGSQNCELKDGWNYKDFFSSFNQASIDALAVVQAIVKAYDAYYEKNTLQNTYSLSVLDLHQLAPLAAKLNDIIAVSKQMFAENKSVFKAAVLKARENSPHMCQASYYLDLWSVYTNLLAELESPEAATLNAAMVATLKQLLMQGQDCIKAAVVANAIGTAVSSLHGISIYFPRNRVEESYLTTPFAQETTWVDFLKEVVG